MPREKKQPAWNNTNRSQKQAKPRNIVDINQYELAIINRVLRNPKQRSSFLRLNVSSKRRILRIQKRNLEELCKSLGIEYREDKLEEILDRLTDYSFLGFPLED